MNSIMSKSSSFQISNSSEDEIEDSYDLIQEVVINQNSNKKEVFSI